MVTSIFCHLALFRRNAQVTLRVTSKSDCIKCSVLCPPLPLKKMGGHWFSTNANHQPGANGGGSPPILAPKTRNGGEAKKYKKCLKETTFDVFCTKISLIWDRKSQFSRALRARSIIHCTITLFALLLRSKSRMFYKNMCPKMSTMHRKTRESHSKRQKRTYTAKNYVFHSVQENFFGGCPHPGFSNGGGRLPSALRRTRYKTLECRTFARVL